MEQLSRRFGGRITGWTLTAALALALAAGGCGRDDDEASIEERLAETGTMDVLEQAGEAEYDPPADGELTEDQVEMYIAVQERAWKIRQVAAKNVEEKAKTAEGEERQVGLLDAMRTMGDVGDFFTAELRAAQELGHNAAEYQWVQGKVLEAQMARATAGMREQMAGVGDQVVEMLEAQREAATDDATRRQLDEQIAEAKKGFAEAQQDDADAWEPGVEHNMALVAKYDEKIQELQKRLAEPAS